MLERECLILGTNLETRVSPRVSITVHCSVYLVLLTREWTFLLSLLLLDALIDDGY